MHTLRSQMGAALCVGMHSAAVLALHWWLQMTCCMPRASPVWSWQTNLRTAVSSSSKPWGLLLLQRSDCQLPLPARRQHVSLSRSAWPGRPLRLPHCRRILNMLLKLLQRQLCTPHPK